MPEPMIAVTESAELPRMPFEQEHPLCPAPVLRALAASGPIHRVRTRAGDEAWLVTGYDEVNSLYSGNLLSRAHPRPDRAARLTTSALFGGRPREDYRTENADRAWIREILHASVGPGPLRELRPWVDSLVTAILDELAATSRPADLIDKVAVPLPTLVICKVLGVPEENLPQYRQWADAIACAGDEQRSQTALEELTEHLAGLAATGKVTPGGLVGRLQAPPYRIPAAVIGHIGASLMFTGHHTTVVAIGYGALLLLTSPDQRSALLADPAKLPGMVEESLRIGNVGVNTGGGNGIPTYARSDFDLAGVRIHAGDLVLLDTGAANNDERVFGDGYRFDIDRQDCPHLTFGFGRRYCPGAGLARLEMQALFAQLLQRFPAMRLAVPLAEVRSHDDVITGGLVALPVTW